MPMWVEIALNKLQVEEGKNSLLIMSVNFFSSHNNLQLL